MNNKNRLNWLPKALHSDENTPFIEWLRDRGSLTARLQARGTFAVHLLRQELALPTPDEAQALSIRSREYAWVREVALYCNGKPVVFAHTVLPYRPRGPLTNWLARLGTRSLGAMLFAHAGFRRGEIVCRRLNQKHPLFQRAVEAMQLSHSSPGMLWARRSHFSFDNQAVLVTEVFSPELATMTYRPIVDTQN